MDQKKQIVNYHYEDIDFRIKDEDLYSDWLIKICTSHQKSLIEINYIFCSDDYLLKINQTYLDHNTFTDIITFPYSYDPIESDVYISIDRITENANTFQVHFDHELKRVMAHGLLHLIGFNDKTEEEQTNMTIAEDNAIALFKES